MRESRENTRFSHQGNLPLLLSDPGSYRTGKKNQRWQMHTAATRIRKPLFSPYRMDFLKSYERELPSSFPVSHPCQGCVMITFRIPLLYLQDGKIRRKVHQWCFLPGCWRGLSEQPPGLINKFYRLMAGIIGFPERRGSHDGESKTGFPYAVGVQ